MWVGSLMPWVDPETIGPQKIAYYAWNYAIFAVPNILLTSAMLFALATVLRSMMAAYIGTVALVMGYLVTTGILGPKIEYRDALARYDLMGLGALGEATRYWTQSEMNSRLVELGGNVLFNRVLAIVVAFLFLGFTLWRFTMTDRAPSRRKLRKLARRGAKEERLAAVPPQLDGARIIARDSVTSRSTQFASRLRLEVRQVLTSPGLLILSLLGIGFPPRAVAGPIDLRTTEHSPCRRRSRPVRGNFSIFLLISPSSTEASWCGGSETAAQ